MADELTLRPIGVVRNELRRGVSAPRARAPRSVIELRPELAEGLDGLAPGQDLVIVFAFHQSAGPAPLRQHRQGDPQEPLLGVFSLRSPHRPNPLGLTTVRVLEVEGNRLVVAGLDAYDGTPVLDIKPYVAWLDAPQAAQEE